MDKIKTAENKLSYLKRKIKKLEQKRDNINKAVELDKLKVEVEIQDKRNELTEIVILLGDMNRAKSDIKMLSWACALFICLFFWSLIL